MGPDQLPRLLRTCSALFAAAVFAAVAAPGAVASAPIDVHAASDAGVRDYWSAARMREAEPLAPLSAGRPEAGGAGAAPSGAPVEVDPVEPGTAAVADLERGLSGETAARGGGYTRSEVPEPSAEAVRMHGKVFLTIKGGSAAGDYVCSGTALSSNNQSVVWTAGHCVFDTDGGGYAKNWIFVPGYKDGAAPFGKWPAVKLAAPESWRKNANLSYDLGAVQVARNGAGQPLTSVVGGRGIGFNQPRAQQYSSFGYPAEAPPVEFATGEREFRCDSGLGGTDNPDGSGPNTNWIGCDMTGGSSGGGWVADGSLLGLNSYSYCLVLLCEPKMYGPYFDDTAKKLYKQIAGSAEYCQGRKVTIAGTGGDDVLRGTGGKDVIKAGAGKDVIRAAGGKDTVCAGGGRDEVDGQGGRDRLDGDDGDDRMNGGGGRDSCDGGADRDSAKGCEAEHKIP